MDVDNDEQWQRIAATEPEPHEVYWAGEATSEVASGKRAQIIEATMRLIARDGVAALSTRKITREAAVNLAALYYLFGSKDDLLLAVLDAATSAMIATLVAVDGHPGGGLRAALVESFAVLCALLDRVPALPLVRCEVLLYIGRRPAQAVSAFQQQRYLDALEACYRVACGRGELGLIENDALATVVSSSINGLALQMAAGVPAAQQEVTRVKVLRALLALVPTPIGPQARDDGGTACRLVIPFEETIRSMRKQ
jgi:AcrR family transcriptional regulator